MKENEANKAERPTEKVEDLELSSEQADGVQAGTSNEVSTATKGWFRYTTASP